VPIKTGVLQQYPVFAVHLARFNSQHGPRQHQGTNNYMNSMQTGGDKVETEEDGFSGSYLFHVWRAGIDTVMYLGRPFKVFDNQEDAGKSNSSANEAECELFFSTLQGGDRHGDKKTTG
jgi:hypothetical protein